VRGPYPGREAAVSGAPAGRAGLQDARPLTIVHIHTADVGGGAENVARTLHLDLRALGHHSVMLVGRRRGDWPGVIEIPRLRGFPGSRRAAGWLERRLGLQYLYSPGFRAVHRCFPRGTDVVHIHSLHGAQGYADLAALPRLTARWPTVMYLKDMWMLTGHCGYDHGCGRWRTGCGGCPHLDTYPAITRDGTRTNWNRKRRFLRGSRLWVCTPSRWLADLVRESPLFEGKPIRVIPNGLDTAVFRPPVDRDAVRRKFGLGPEERVVLLAANHLHSPVKGVPHAVEALNRLNTSGLTVMLVGADSEKAAAQLAPRSLPLGSQREPAKMAECYAAADLFLMPSLEEVFGMVAAESLACGTPVVAYATGGIPEVLGSEACGILVPTGDIAALADAVGRLLSSPETARKMGRAGARRAAERFSVRRQSNDFLALYREALAAHRSHAAGEAGEGAGRIP